MLKLNRAQEHPLTPATHDEALARHCGRQLGLEAGRVVKQSPLTLVVLKGP
jgi:predicted ABC-type transport system involved in lysophospholipase L1 biosynthesis ATPase subunit